MTPSSPPAAFSSVKPLDDAERFRKHQFRSGQFEWLARRLGRVSNIAAAPIEPSEALGWHLGDPADVGMSVVRSHVARAASRSNAWGVLERFSVDVNRNSKGVPKGAQIRFGLL
jgi:hypothetical protein